MTPGVLARFLVGDRRAILTIAETRGLLPFAALFVLSAGLAREYDGVYLLHESWVLTLPFLASLGTSFFLYVLNSPWSGVSFSKGYPTFLGLYWMTAPLAWLYAIPYERWLSPVAAMQANLATLALVATWRVALMVRTISVLHVVRWYAALFPVLFFADTVLVVVQYFVPVPMQEVMGGVRLSSADNVLRDAKTLVIILGALAWPVLLIGMLVTFYYRRPAWSPSVAGGAPSLSLKALALTSVFVWAPLAVIPQMEQARGSRFARLWNAREFEEAAAFLVALDRHDLPPAWEPPPRVPEDGSIMLSIEFIEALEAHPHGWANEKFEQRLLDAFLPSERFSVDANLALEWLRSTSSGQAFLKRRTGDFKKRIERDWRHAPYRPRLDQIYEDLRELLTRQGVEIVAPPDRDGLPRRTR